MTKLVVGAVALVVAVQALAFTQLERELVLTVTGAALVVALLALRRRLVPDRDPEEEDLGDEAEAALRRWRGRTETLISWAESSRADWDRRLRPMLARQFELAGGHRKVKDPNVYQLTGRMVFGDELWQWVDPQNISRTGGREPGPGREVLHDILVRLAKL
ncbi:hypothetical protein GR927_07450 [Mycolicibacterium sp. 3033]|nr:hypothetical protein [Mycolicibacterium aurantiacum]